MDKHKLDRRCPFGGLDHDQKFHKASVYGKCTTHYAELLGLLRTHYREDEDKIKCEDWKQALDTISLKRDLSRLTYDESVDILYKEVAALELLNKLEKQKEQEGR